MWSSMVPVYTVVGVAIRRHRWGKIRSNALSIHAPTRRAEKLRAK